MLSQSFKIEPEQVEVLIAHLRSKAPPKTQTVFSTKEVVGLVYEFIADSLEQHYSYDELAPMIQQGLVDLHMADELPEIKGSTLKQYYLEVKREREKGGRKKRSSRSSGKRRSDVAESASAASPQTVRQLPRPDDDDIKLAY